METGVSAYTLGSAYYNRSGSLATTGYVYNPSIEEKKNSGAGSEMLYDKALYISTSNLYADSITYSTGTGRYSLVNSYSLSSIGGQISDAVGKYTLLSNSSNATLYAYYVVAVGSSGYAYLIELHNGDFLSDVDNTYTFGDSYTDNGNGTYTINSPTVIYGSELLSNYTDSMGTYVCKNAVNDTCNDVWHLYLFNANQSYFSYFKSSDWYLFANSFIYNSSTGKYTLDNNSISAWDRVDNTTITNIGTHHYTCFDQTGICDTLYYVYSLVRPYYYYVELTSGDGIEDFLSAAFSVTNENKIDSVAKIVIDKWFEKKMMGYRVYLEDSVFCNDRSIFSLGGWDPNGGSITDSLLFSQSNISDDLSCVNMTDRFSVSNPSASLTYPVGLATVNEINMLGSSGTTIFYNSTVGYSTVGYLATPYSTKSMYVFTNSITTDDIYDYDGAQRVTPVISLVPGIRYISGSGSNSDPYIIDAPYYDPDSPTISGGGTKIYGSSNPVFTCSAPASYTGEDPLYYSFGYATSDGGTPSIWSVESLDSSYTVSSTEYIGQRWYSCQVYSYDGENMTSLGISPLSTSKKLIINHATITFDTNVYGASFVGGGGMWRYISAGESVVYNGIQSMTIGSLPIVTKDDYEFLGWYTEPSDGYKVLNDDGTFTGVAVPGYTDGSAWTMTSDKTLYAHWICHGLYCLGSYFTMVPTSTSYSVTRTLTGYTSSQTINPSELTLWRIINVDSHGTVEAISEYVSSTKIYFSGSTGFSKFVGSMRTIASQYEKSGYTDGVRIMGYSGQSTSTSTPTSYPSTTSTPDITSGSGDEYDSGLGGDTMYIDDYLLVSSVYQGDSTYGSTGLVAYSASNHNTATAYWIASRKFSYTSNTNYAFMGRFIDTGGGLGAAQLYYYSSRLRSASAQYAIRPIITLINSLTVASGDGTKSNPYVLN